MISFISRVVRNNKTDVHRWTADSDKLLGKEPHHLPHGANLSPTRVKRPARLLHFSFSDVHNIQTELSAAPAVKFKESPPPPPNPTATTITFTLPTPMFAVFARGTILNQWQTSSASL